MILAKKKPRKRGPSWPWSNGVYISPLMLWVRISIRARCTTLCDKVCQWLATGWCFSPVSSGFLHQQHWPPRYNWNIVESGILHHQTNKQNHAIFPETVQYYFISWRRQDKMILGSIFSQVLLYNNRIIAQISMIIT
jgi:hypothetical protein